MSAGALTFPVEAGCLGDVSEALVSDRPSQSQWEEPLREVSEALIDDRPSQSQCEQPRCTYGVLVGDMVREHTFEKSISEIHGYRDLEKNWDTYGGLGASQQAVQFSVYLLEELRVRPEISPPRVSPISTGVYLEWRAGERLLYFEVDEDSVLFVMQEGERHREDGEDPDFDVARAVDIVKRLHGEDDMSAEGITQYST